jgi:propanediol dehydratase small subunit
MGIRWRRRFPTSPKTEIRRFLDLFLDAFGFPARRRSYFSPDDKILDVYHALYPPGDALADCMDLETFANDIQKHYGVDLAGVWHDDLTLGELYARIHQVA